MKGNAQNVPIPSWSLPYLINGDASGLTEEEIGQVDDYVNLAENPDIISPEGGEEFFTKSPEFGLPATCTNCTLVWR